MLFTPPKDINNIFNKTKSFMGLSPNSNPVFGFDIYNAIPMPSLANPLLKVFSSYFSYS